MRISDRLIPVALLGVGVVSAFAFDGSGGRDGMSPAVSVDVVPRSALSAPAVAVPAVAVPTVAVPTVAVPNAPMSGTLRGPELKHALTPVEAFRSGAQALRAGDAQTGLRALGGYYISGIPNSAVTASPSRARDLFAYAASYFGDADA